ncbi:MAG: MBL fold metallo-hydrolase [Pseudomonadales bacterium]
MGTIKAVCFTLLFLFSTSVMGDWVAPADRVQDSISMRTGPGTQFDFIGPLAVGDRVLLLGSVPYWYQVELPNGNKAYVSKAWSQITTEASPAVPVSSYKIDIIDVGTGLAVLVQGKDFSLLYDGGSNDDYARGANNRLMAYLKAVYPALTAIDHVILSHPHRDHVELLPDVMATYSIGAAWDSGRTHDICGYRAFIDGIVAGNIEYHTAKHNHGTHPVKFTKDTGNCYGEPRPAKEIDVIYGSQINEGQISLGAGASMQFLYASGHKHSSPNENSLVLRLALGNHKILLMGDAEAGSRGGWADGDPEHDSIEGMLLACCSSDLKADILVAGHHGSRTSSRTAFLDAVDAQTYIISSGPKKYGRIILPDQVVVDEFLNRGTVLRTDRDDVACAISTSKIGTDGDGKAGGCDNIRIILNDTITSDYIN